ncbi:MAG: right-handed parallel beta-helix repeat-containing protein [Muribaculaceae bacterium]|nr:right-handed parallel beta-helix repeat-containing protein [Muribaculaceae bacterium]
MKKIFTLLLMAAAVIGSQAKVYTFEDLSKIDGTGVTKADDGSYLVTMNTSLANSDTVKLDDNNILVLKAQLVITNGNTLKIQNNDVIKFGASAQVRVEGEADFAPTDTATVTAADGATGTAKGFWIFGSKQRTNAVIKNVTFEYVGITFGNDLDNDGHLEMSNCTVKYNNGKIASGQAINFNATCKGNIIENCHFEANTVSAIGSGSNTPVGITIRNNMFYKNSTTKRNRPQINMSCNACPYDIVIEGNTVIGIAENTLAGGIAVSNLLAGKGAGKIYVRNNKISDNRYGITGTGAMDIYIENNECVNNKYEATPANGGSGINLTQNSTNKTSYAYLRGNHVEGNLWGVTVIGWKEVNMGRNNLPTDDPEYNPGENILKDNVCNGETVDLANMTDAMVYALGNTWSVPISRVWDVISLGANTPRENVVVETPFVAVDDVNVDREIAGVQYVNLAGQVSNTPFEGVNIVVTQYTDGNRNVVKVVK